MASGKVEYLENLQKNSSELVDAAGGFILSLVLQDANEMLPQCARLGYLAVEHYLLWTKLNAMSKHEQGVVLATKAAAVQGIQQSLRRAFDSSKATTNETLENGLRQLTDVRTFVSEIGIVRSLNTALAGQQAQEDDVHATQHANLDCDGYVNDVNIVLGRLFYKQLQCSCKRGKTRLPAGHQCAIQLHASPQISADSVSFSLMCSSTAIDQVPHWQSLEINIKSAGAMNDSVAPEVLVSDKALDPIRPVRICRLLGRDLGNTTRRLELRNGLLHRENSPTRHKHPVTQPVVSLDKICAFQDLSSVARVNLAYVLAKSLWQYYDSEFANVPWLIENICFIMDLSQDTKLPQEGLYDMLAPYLLLHTSSSDWKDSESLKGDTTLLHKYPRVLSLGVILVLLGSSSDTCVRIEKFQGNRARWLNNLYGCVDYTEDEAWPQFGLRHKSVKEKYKAVASQCFNRTLFLPFDSLELRRQCLYEKIVRPLQELLQDMNRLDPLGKSTGKNSGRFIINPDTTHLEIIRNEPDTLIKYSLADMHKSLEWIAKIVDSKYSQGLCNDFNKAGRACERIKIAVLDTGANLSLKFFQDAAKQVRIKAWHDMTDDSSGYCDLDGHGTNVLSLVMRIAPFADVYLFRIASNKEDLGSHTAPNIARAIKLAANIGVDIVTMSFGWETANGSYLNLIKDSIGNLLRDYQDPKRKGSRRGTLFFAAAGNEGLNQSVSFPASADTVIPIRATDSYGGFLGFNPQHSGDDAYGTLGYAVPVNGSVTITADTVAHSGTSIATPIAAGIAANILASARLRIHQAVPLPRHLDLHALWTKNGMLREFKKLSAESDKKQRYLSMNIVRETGDTLDALNAIVNSVPRKD